MKTHWHWVKGWARGTFQDGRVFEAPVWAGSDESESDARLSLSQAIADRVSRWGHRSSQKTPQESSKEYGLSDLVECLLERGEESELGGWAITRNGYGCQTLCVEKLLIADIDCNQWGAARPIHIEDPGLFESLWNQCLKLTPSGAARVEQKHQDRLAWKTANQEALKLWIGAPLDRVQSLTRICRVAMDDPSLSLDIHRTTRGFRVIERSRAWDPRSESTKKLMEELGCDGVYMTLCRKQDCFRARLEAKPWRCGSQRPSARYPFEDAVSQVAFEQWLAAFQKKAKVRRACAWVGHVGASESWHPADKLCELHEHRSGSHETTKRLA